MYKPSELAQELNISIQTIHRWIGEGKLKAIRLPSGTYRIKEEEVNRIKDDENKMVDTPQD